ncbi:MAG: hypothetical protein ACRELC_06625, partial [Gemmatimonadota bacterium]
MVFAQSVLKRIREHAGTVPHESVAGLLVGRVFADPAGGRPWVHVESSVAADGLVPESSSDTLLTALEATAVHIEPGRVAAGWYRTHRTTGLFLSEEEARMHAARFPAPWQCAVVLLGNESHPTGGVFQPIAPDGLVRGLYTPFYELVDPSSELGGRTRRTFVGWGNYETESIVRIAG